MFFNEPIRGDQLDPGCFMLTYDDGPGSREGGSSGPCTWPLAQYLYGQSIQATFFVTGVHAERHLDIVRSLKALGHLIGNHTCSHPSLLALPRDEIIAEVSRTDTIIRRHIDPDPCLFRAPYGDWRRRGGLHDAAAAVEDDSHAALLNTCAATRHYVGPIHWDIDAKDYEYWRGVRPGGQGACVHNYVAEITRKRRGIILMHDSSADDPVSRVNNQALELTQHLVPWLKEQGGRFLRLDAVPQVRAAIQAVPPGGTSP